MCCYCKAINCCRYTFSRIFYELKILEKFYFVLDKVSPLEKWFQTKKFLITSLLGGSYVTMTPDTITDNTVSGKTEDSQFKLVDRHGESVENGIGLLLYNGGTVCDDGFNSNAANAICGEMGYTDYLYFIREPYYGSPTGKLKYILVGIYKIK